MLRIDDRRLLVGGALVATLAGTGVRVQADDATMRTRVEDRLRKANVDGSVEAQVVDGTVVLDGFVTTAGAKAEAEKAAAKESKNLKSRLRVVPEARPDDAILAAAEKAVLGYVRYGVFDSVGLMVEDGVVTLNGSVRDPDRRSDLEKRVAGLSGVREVKNQIGVQSASLYDEQLRQQLAWAIYGDLLQRFASSPNPPVRILVDRGRVTLTGYVSSRVEQAMLGHLARSFMAFGVDNRVEVESERRREPAPARTHES
jgi:osmotically-inducible protein OsmY